MAKDKLTEYDSNAANNTVVGDVNLAENSALPSDMNNAVREVMSHLKAFSDGTDAITGLTVDGNIKLDGNYPTGTNNVALGDAALGGGSLSGGSNVAIGTSALDANTSGTTNIAIGVNALGANTTASDNVAVGHSTLKLNTTGASNVAVGYEALDANTTAPNNTAVGYAALTANTTGDTNVAVGKDSMKANTTGTNNTALGPRTLQANTTAVNNVAVGDLALGANTTGASNTGVGVNTLTSNTTASNNTAVGRDALQNDTTGAENTAVGRSAGSAVTTASNCTLMGYNAGSSIQAGTNTTAIGYQAGDAIVDTVNNVMVGVNAGGALNSDSNTCIGTGAGETITSGAKNTILGRYNGNQGSLDIRTSSNNIVLSDGDGNPRLFIDSGGINYIGGTTARAKFNVQRSDASSFNYASISVSNQPDHFVFFTDSTQTGSISRSGGTGVNYNTSSDYRLKQGVEDITGAIDRVKALAPKRFQFTAEPDTTVDGFLAHEAQTVVPEAVTGTHNEVDDDGNAVMQGIDQSKLVPLLCAALKESIAKIETLETKVAALEAE